MIRAIIIEDEEDSRDALQSIIKNNFKDVELMAICTNVEEGKDVIEKLHPDLVFSDIELGVHSAFDMLQELKTIDFEIIFTTGYEKYAIQAIKFSALDYILKPYSKEDLTLAINLYHQKQNKKQSASQFDALFHNLKHLQKDSKKIALPSTNGLIIVPVKDIIRCEADVNYTHFYLVNKEKILVSKTLKDYEELLEEYDFIRIHNSHLINLHYVKNYTRGDGGFVTLTDGSQVDVSRKKKDEFLKRLAEI